MSYPFSIHRLFNPTDSHIWVQIRILYETEKAVLVYNGRKFCIPKSRIYKVRLRKNVFEFYVKERVIG